MNKLILRNARKSGFSIIGNSIDYNEHSIDLNSFPIEINKLHFTHSVSTSIDIFKENLSRENQFK